MNYIIEKIRGYWKWLIGCVCLTILLFSIYIYNQESHYQVKESESASTMEMVSLEKEVPPEEESKNVIYIDIKGAVKNPGVYELEADSRVIHAIEKSGGLNKNADTSVINLSKKLEDGNVIIIYTKDKIEEIQKQEVIIEYIEKECTCPDKENSACISENDAVIKNEDSSSSTDDSSQKVSLNKATKEELLTLPGIGEAKAEDILSYREEQGNFKSIEDIKNVKGIGDVLFEKIKAYLTL